MKWQILYTEQAKEDLKCIYEYIAYTLLEQGTAAGQTRAIMDEISSLNDMPFRYRLYEVEPWQSKGVHILTVGKYVVLYQPDEAGHVVNIVRILYGGRDI